MFFDEHSELDPKEQKEIDALYPKGTTERDVLEYSRGTHGHEAVPPMLLAAFKVLVGISAIMGLASLVAFLNN